MGDMIPIEKHMKAIESAIDHIAYVRRMAEVEGHDMEEFDAEMNKLCDKHHNKYAPMGEIALALKGMADILQSDRAEEFIEQMTKEFEE